MGARARASVKSWAIADQPLLHLMNMEVWRKETIVFVFEIFH